MTDTLTMITANPAADEERRRGLRRMRTLAVGLLLFAAVVYVADARPGRLPRASSTPAPRRRWSARSPTGSPSPRSSSTRSGCRSRTPRWSRSARTSSARALEEFFGENFLQEAIIRDRVGGGDDLAAARARGSPARTTPAGSSTRSPTSPSIGLARVSDEHVAELVESVLVPRFREEPIAPLLGTFVVEVVRDDLHHGVVDLALEELHRWLVENPETFAEVLSERAPWWAPTAAQRGGHRADPHRGGRAGSTTSATTRATTPARRSTRCSASSARTCCSTPRPRRAPRGSRSGCSTTRSSSPTGISLWNALRRALLAGARATRAARSATGCSASWSPSPSGSTADEALRARLDGLAADAAVFAVERYGAELTAVITHTIERWDGKEAARRIELHVGRDLQFIRINGTIVGGLVGVLIHTVSVLI